LSLEGKEFELVGKTYKYDKEIEIYDTLKCKEDKNKCIDLLSAKLGKLSNMKEAKLKSIDLLKFKWLNRIEMVEKFNENPWRLMKQFESKSAGIKLMSAHQSKGLEYDNVVLANDYRKLVEPKTNTLNNNLQDDDYNIMYVSMTRAKKNLYINDNIANFLRIKHQFNINVDVVSKYDACHNCGKKTNQTVTHSINHLPCYIKPNFEVKTTYCLDCINVYLDSVSVINTYFNRN
jgi:superfamily I DNA/RNA helicase